MHPRLIMESSCCKKLKEFSFEQKGKRYKYFEYESLVEVCFFVVVTGGDIFGNGKSYCFSSLKAADSFILFIKNIALQEYINKLDEIAKTIDSWFKFELEIFFASNLEMNEEDTFKP